MVKVESPCGTCIHSNVCRNVDKPGGIAEEIVNKLDIDMSGMNVFIVCPNHYETSSIKANNEKGVNTDWLF